MSATANNNFAQKYKTSEERRSLCQRYIEYIQTGRSKEYFPDCAIQTFEKYVKAFPQDFDTEKIGEAERIGLGKLEQIGFDGMLGKIPGFNAAAWIFTTKNRLGWRDKQDLTTASGRFEPMNVIVSREQPHILEIELPNKH